MWHSVMSKEADMPGATKAKKGELKPFTRMASLVFAAIFALPILATAADSRQMDAEHALAESEDKLATEQSALANVSAVLNSFWELTPADKQGTYLVRTYQPNFMLPYQYSSNINKQPHTPTLGAAPYQENYLSHEVKFQISLRAKVLEDILLPNADLWFAYTQTSQWQLWNSEDSAPFRSTDYQPEITYVIPMADYVGTLPFGWNLSLLQLGFVHQSNGQSEPLSRSWNRFYAGLALERERFALFYKIHKRISEPLHKDDNPDLIDYIGKSELSLTWVPVVGSATLSRRINWRNHQRGAWQLDLSYPLSRTNPERLRWYLQFFSGYGETLLDYNHRQNTFGVGVMLFNF